jgi:hypothetical protein
MLSDRNQYLLLRWSGCSGSRSPALSFPRRLDMVDDPDFHRGLRGVVVIVNGLWQAKFVIIIALVGDPYARADISG